ncbi:helix-turn-helix transcriptional regulator (plasmid) [Thioclava litoralis]|uniref:Helix-turn-helix transcriptional regulator n=1 Tax=Thioclava litoralis TaxID=3076557 RepID=A0ABZ1E5G8_9RHOB|nr:helix-turn-helix transcriptional regulator [Thioclava sp. FTW29]
MKDLSPKNRQAVLAIVILLQGVAVLFFASDALADAVSGSAFVETAMELFVAVMLVVGLYMGIIQLRALMGDLAEKNRALDIARGHFSRVVERQFEDWALTPAEREVALFALKGLDAAEIAGLRGAANGTVRAQLTRIYAKAGVSNRAQLAAFFVEDLLTEPVPDA